MRMYRPLFAFFFLLPLACSSPAKNSVPPPCAGVAPDAAEACLTEHYFKGYAAQPLDACQGFVPTTQKVAGRKEIFFFLGGPSVDGAAQIEGQFLQRFYETYDLTFFTKEPAGYANV